MSTSFVKGEHSVVLRRESRVRSYARAFPAFFARASGSYLYDHEGNAYLDFLSGCASLNYGHNDPTMKQALIEHILNDGIAQGLDLATTAKRDFLDAFERHILEPRRLDYRVHFTGPTGANAVEAALKLARKVTGRTNVIAFTNGYHGVSLGALSATGNRHHRGASGMPLAGVQRAAFDGYHGESIDTVDLLDRLLNDPSSGVDAPAAFLVETVQGEGGLNAASEQWLQRLAKLARRQGALLIADDIQAGCGRAGGFFSFEAAGIEPDLVTMSKSLSGFGLPMSVLLIRPEHDQWKPAEHNGTFRGNNHAFVTARIAIEKFWSDKSFAIEVERKGRVITERLERFANDIPGARVKGRGMMRGLDLVTGDLADEVARTCYQQGLIIETAGPYDEVLKLLPPLTASDEELKAGLDIIEESIAQTMPKSRAA